MTAATAVMVEVKQLDAEQMEEFLVQLGNYFQDSAEELTNMDAKRIARSIHCAARTLGDRTGN